MAVGTLSAQGVPSDTTAAAMEERAKFQRHFARFDMLFFLICALVGLDTLGTVASYGAQGFTWMLFIGVFFFLPYGLLTAELGSAFTDEGAPYTWSRMAFGRLVAAINQVPSWLSNPIWLGGTLAITAVATMDKFVFPTNGIGAQLFSLVFIWFAVTSAIVGLNIGKWVPNIGAMARVAILALFVVSVVGYAIQNGVHGFGGGDFLPTYALFIAVVPVLIFNFVGFETPNAAGEELKNPQKDVPFAVARAGVLTVLLYGLPVLGILLVLPTSQVTNLGGFLNAMKTVFTIYGGSVASDGTATLTGFGSVLGTVVALGFVWALATSGTTWIMSADRAQAVAGYDGAAPRFMGRISARFGTPVVVNTLTGIVSTIVMILAFAITGGDAHKYFSAVLALAISTTTITYIPMFVAAIVLRYNKYKDIKRPYRVPFGNIGMWVCSVLTVGFCILATISVIWPGFGTSDPEAALTSLGWAGERTKFEIVQIAPLVVMGLIGVLFYYLGAPTRKKLAPSVAVASPALAGAGD